MSAAVMPQRTISGVPESQPRPFVAAGQADRAGQDVGVAQHERGLMPAVPLRGVDRELV